MVFIHLWQNTDRSISCCCCAREQTAQYKLGLLKWMNFWNKKEELVFFRVQLQLNQFKHPIRHYDLNQWSWSHFACWQKQSCSSLAGLVWRALACQFSPTAAGLSRRQPVSSCRQPASPVLLVISLLSGPALQEVQACTFVWHLTAIGLPQHRLWRALCKMWAFLCGFLTLEAVETCELRTHQSCQNAAMSKQPNQPCTEHQSLPQQLSRRGRQGFVPVLLCFKLNCLGHPYTFQFLVSFEKDRGN